jgi:integrase
MEKSFGLLFFLRKPKNSKDENVYVYMRITVNKSYCDISTKRKCNPEKWNQDAGRLRGKTDEIKSFNSYLDTLQQKVFEAKRKLIETDKLLSPENIKTILLGKEIHQKKYMLMEIFRHHNDQMAALVGKDFMGFKMTKKEVERTPLTETELKALMSKRFSSDRLNNVRDIFVFSCFSGLAYADVKKLKRSEIIIGIDGEKWLISKRQKTDISARIPLLPVALSLVDKYADHPQCISEDRVLPVLSNQKMNAYLKEIADLCGINKNLTYHIARHTFATTVTLSNGVPIETVSKMLGHRNLRTTQHYARILDRKISDDMKRLRDKFVE